MPRDCCGFDGPGASDGDTRRDAAPVPHDMALAPGHCERCGAEFSVEGPAALFLAKLKLLGQFGLAAHTRLLLGTTREDG
jgi:hypothetical protein